MDDNTDAPPPDDLEKRIHLARKQNGQEGKKEVSGAASAFQASTELLAGVAVGACSGYYLDKWLTTPPIFFVICFFLGAIAGGYNIYRSVQPDTTRQDTGNNTTDKENQ
jgi:F0F1-type ATP synthase assembly protein I